MYVVGLTGGIGSGKSTVARALGDRGAVVIDVDALGRKVLEPGERAHQPVIDRFGEGIVAPDGTIDRAALASVVFSDPAELADLEAISHPAINADLDDQLSALGDDAVVVLDLAVLVESRLGRLDSGRGYELVVVVETPDEIRIPRLIDRGMSEADARSRIAAQATTEQRRAVADLVISNGGDLEALERTVDSLWTTIVRNAERKRLLAAAAAGARRYLDRLDGRAVAPSDESVAALADLDRPLPEGPSDPAATVTALIDLAAPATVATAGGRYFGFVIGGTHPAALAASWLASAWDQNTALSVMSPAATHLDATALGWVADLLGLDAGTGGGFVSGATMANASGLAVGRDRQLAAAGWDAVADGLVGAPPITVYLGAEAHSTVRKGARAHRSRSRPRPGPADRRAGEHRRSRPADHRGADDGVPAGREHGRWRLRSLRRADRVGPRGGGLGARRWGVRPVGRGQPAPSPPHRRRRRRRQLGDRHPQVAERPVRQRVGARA